jgi:hypothetical protein
MKSLPAICAGVMPNSAWTTGSVRSSTGWTVTRMETRSRGARANTVSAASFSNSASAPSAL